MSQWLAALSPLISAGLVLLFMRYWFNGLLARVEKIEQEWRQFFHGYNAAQLAAKDEYACKRDMVEIDRRVDKHDQRITRLETWREAAQ